MAGVVIGFVLGMLSAFVMSIVLFFSLPHILNRINKK